MANNILKKAYVGKNLAYRGYYNNQIVWDFGKCVNTDLIATLPGIAQARAGDTIDIYMYSDNFIQGKGLSKILVADNNLGQAEVQFLLNSLSQSSTAHNLAGLVQIKIGANGQIRSYAIVYTEGSVDCKMYLLATPNSASVVYNSGDLFIKWVQIAKSYAQEFSKIFFAVEGGCGGLCEPHIQNLESTIMNIEGNIKTNVFVGTLPVYTVTFMNDEVILCWARVPEGHDSPDPLNVEANETILKQQYLNPFEWWESDNISSLEFFPSKKIQIVPEGVYTIIWDGIEYSDIAKKITEEVICFGQLEESSQGNLYPIFSKFPFIILFSNQENRFIFMANDKKVSHTLTLIEKNTPVIQTPQKESTPQYYFTFSGWGRENGGEPDENALKNIIQDTDIYAIFEAIIRQYSASFYDQDGQLMQQSLVNYGEEATPPDTTKTGYEFIGWTPSNLIIYTDTNFIGSWEKIKTISYYTTISGRISGKSIGINKTGTNIAFALENTATMYPQIYDIATKEPVQITPVSSISPTQYYWRCTYNFDDSRLCTTTVLNNTPRYHIYDTSNYKVIKTQVLGSLGDPSIMQCSPSNNLIAVGRGTSNAYYIEIREIDNVSVIVKTLPTIAASLQDITFNTTGDKVAVATTKGCYIYDINNGTLIQQIDSSISLKSVSWQNNFLVISGTSYCKVYDTSSWTELYDLTNFITLNHPIRGKADFYTELIANSKFVFVGCSYGDKSYNDHYEILVFDLSKETPRINNNIPQYDGTDRTTYINSNFSGNKVAIISDTNIEIWSIE